MYYNIVVINFFVDFRQHDYFGGDILMMREDPDSMGIENKTQSSGNIYEYRDMPLKNRALGLEPRKTVSTPSLRSASNSSLAKEAVSSSPNGEPRPRPRTPPARKLTNRRPESREGVPMTDV